MSTKYFALLTRAGAAMLAKATATGMKIEITHMAIGDGNGVLPVPDPAQTALTHEIRRAPLNLLTIDPVNTNQIIAEQVIPEDVGGWWIREVGLFDKNGNMIAIANCAETYKPQLQEGSGRVQVIRVILVVSNTEAVTLKIDPSVVLATRKYTDDAVTEVKGYSDSVMEKHIADKNPHSQYLLTANALKEIASAGLAADVLKNLGLGEGSALPVGVPVPWPSATPPTGWLQCNGAAFTRTQYPKLAQAYPNLRLPDLRGEFIRGWDDGRKVDAGRALLSAQAATLLRTAMLDYYNQDATGATGIVGMGFNNEDSITNLPEGSFKMPDGSTYNTPPVVMSDNGIQGTVLTTIRSGYAKGITVRPRNIAFNYIVRAA
ncbi:TPA: phage tail protein [Escherichia coli]|nr:phage tail protein [Escherichia coli]HBA9519647.1 phage tail protein [Escherichia coli]HBA9548886.1 phage tail protein [Escherichia coli]HBA9557025.1 phage tail protein [Escherichia coli]